MGGVALTGHGNFIAERCDLGGVGENTGYCKMCFVGGSHPGMDEGEINKTDCNMKRKTNFHKKDRHGYHGD
jgi:hypothetical protein